MPDSSKAGLATDQKVTAGLSGDLTVQPTEAADRGAPYTEDDQPSREPSIGRPFTCESLPDWLNCFRLLQSTRVFDFGVAVARHLRAWFGDHRCCAGHAKW